MMGISLLVACTVDAAGRSAAATAKRLVGGIPGIEHKWLSSNLR